MHQQLEHTITRLNEISGTILEELKAEEPKLELIKEGLESREEYLQVLGVIQKNKEVLAMDQKKLGLIRPLFDSFITMNDDIQKRIALLVDQQVEVLASARKQRKVQDSYAVSKTPSVSYF